MNIVNEVWNLRQDFTRNSGGRYPDRLIITYDKFNELMTEPEIYRHATWTHIMGMLIVRTGADIPEGMEVR